MLIVISPAKTLNMEKISNAFSTNAVFPKESEYLVSLLRQYSDRELEDMMSISSKLAVLNEQRFKEWKLPVTDENGKQAVFAFSGEVYTGLDASSFNDDDISFSQLHLRILSGLYGVLKPTDLIAAYRLEMGTKLPNDKGDTLYAFWGDKINKEVQKAIDEQGDNILINLASNEYFKSVQSKNLDANIITPEFKDYKNGQYKVISFYAKKARGLMTRFIIKNKISDPEQLKLFDQEGYFYNDELSNGNKLVFTRG